MALWLELRTRVELGALAGSSGTFKIGRNWNSQRLPQAWRTMSASGQVIAARQSTRLCVYRFNMAGDVLWRVRPCPSWVRGTHAHTAGFIGHAMLRGASPERADAMLLLATSRCSRHAAREKLNG